MAGVAGSERDEGLGADDEEEKESLHAMNVAGGMGTWDLDAELEAEEEEARRDEGMPVEGSESEHEAGVGGGTLPSPVLFEKTGRASSALRSKRSELKKEVASLPAEGRRAWVESLSKDGLALFLKSCVGQKSAKRKFPGGAADALEKDEEGDAGGALKVLEEEVGAELKRRLEKDSENKVKMVRKMTRDGTGRGDSPPSGSHVPVGGGSSVEVFGIVYRRPPPPNTPAGTPRIQNASFLFAHRK